MAKRLLGILLCLLLLPSCSYIPTGYTEELLSAPTVNDQQAKVRAALEATLNLSNIQYRYIQTGDYRSPFVFFELDGSGRRGAVVFYAYKGDPSNTAARAKVLRENDDGEWAQVFDISELGEQINFIQFSNLLDRDNKCMVIGWQNARGSPMMGVYSLSEYGVEKRELSCPYSFYLIDDFDDSGVEEILTISWDVDADQLSLYLYGRGLGGRLEQLSRLALAEDVEVLQMIAGRLRNGKAIYIDELLDGSIIATEIVSVSGGKLTPEVTEQNGVLYSATFREYEDQLSTDLEKDGVVVIPLYHALPGQSSNEEIENVPLTEYIRLGEEGFETAYSGVYNDSDGYVLFFPDRWLGQVTVERQPETREWRFLALDPETKQPSDELLRIRVYSAGDYRDKFAADYKKLDERGQLEYHAYIPAAEGSFLAVSEQEIRRMFLPLR